MGNCNDTQYDSTKEITYMPNLSQHSIRIILNESVSSDPVFKSFDVSLTGLPTPSNSFRSKTVRQTLPDESIYVDTVVKRKA